MGSQHVYFFGEGKADGNASMKNLLGGKGAARTLERGGISALTFEFGSGNVNSRTFFRDFWELLSGHGYRIERIIPGGRTVPVDNYGEELEYFRGATNYIATLRNG